MGEAKLRFWRQAAGGAGAMHLRSNAKRACEAASVFKVGQTLATTPGAVVFRNEMVELLQYQPMTPQVCERLTLLIVPPIGKYCFMGPGTEAQFRRIRGVAGGSDACEKLAQPRPRTCISRHDSVKDAPSIHLVSPTEILQRPLPPVAPVDGS